MPCNFSTDFYNIIKLCSLKFLLMSFNLLADHLSSKFLFRGLLKCGSYHIKKADISLGISCFKLTWNVNEIVMAPLHFYRARRKPRDCYDFLKHLKGWQAEGNKTFIPLHTRSVYHEEIFNDIVGIWIFMWMAHATSRPTCGVYEYLSFRIANADATRSLQTVS